MNKKLVFLTISLVSLQAFTAQSAEVLSTGELLRQEHQEIYNNSDLSLTTQISLTQEGIQGLKNSIQKLRSEEKEAYLLNLRKLFGFSQDDNAKKIASIFSKLLITEKLRLENLLFSHAIEMASTERTPKEKTRAGMNERKQKAKDLYAARANTAVTSSPTASKQTAYSLEMVDTGVTLENDGPLALACFSIIDCQKKLQTIGAHNIGLMSDAGLCPCCGIIDNSKQIIHQYFPRTDTKPLQIPYLEMNGFQLDKEPTKWLLAVQRHPDFTTWGYEQRAAAEKIVNHFLLVREGTKNKALVAEALRTIHQYDWVCQPRSGIISDDGEILEAIS